MLGRRRRQEGGADADQIPATMMALAKHLQIETGSPAMQTLVEMIGIAASEDPERTARDFGCSDTARAIATRDPIEAEVAASKFLVVATAFAHDTLDPDQVVTVVQYAGMLATRFPEFAATERP